MENQNFQMRSMLQNLSRYLIFRGCQDFFQYMARLEGPIWHTIHLQKQ